MNIAVTSTCAAPLSSGVTPDEVPSAPRLSSPLTPGETMTSRYLLYGEVVQSEIPLPVPSLVSGAASAGLMFRRAVGSPTLSRIPLAVRRGRDGELLSARCRDTNGEWIRHANLGTFHIVPDFTLVNVYPEPGVTDELLGLVLIGQISTFILFCRGLPCLHASAAVVQEQGVAFVGTNGQGKSTMAGAFLVRGGTLLTDDALPLRMEGEGVYGGPGLPLMKMWQDTAKTLAEPADLRNLPLLSKKLLALEGRYPFASAPTRLRQLFVLSRYQVAPGEQPIITHRRLSIQEGVAVLLAQTSWNMLLTREEVAQLLPFYAKVCRHLPISVLRYPNGYEHQDAVHRHIVRELSCP